MNARHLPRRSLLRSAASSAALAMVPFSTALAAYPDRPVRLVVPYGPGGAVDTVARAIAERMARLLDQPIVVENRTGAGSNIGSQFVAKAAPDGYTLLMASPANVTSPFLYQNMGYDPARDLVPVGLAAQVPSVLVAAPTVPVATVADVIAHAKGPSSPISVAHGGGGSSEHLAAELFRMSTRIDLTLVPYRGAAAAFPDLMSGRVQYMFSNLLGVLPHIRAGKLKAIAIADDQRSPLIPEVPTFAEAGLPDMMVSVWYGLMAPTGTPGPVIDRLAAAMQSALKEDELRTRLEQSSARVLARGPRDFEAFLKHESSRWGTVIRAAGITLD